MALPAELRDPWGVLVAGVAAGSAWAVGLPLAAAVGVGGAVLAVKAATAAVMGPVRHRPRQLPVRERSAEQGWLTRAGRAVGSFQSLAASSPEGPLAERYATMGEQARSTLEAMRRLAGQVSSVSASLARVEGSRLAGDEARLVAQLHSAQDDDVRSELRRSLEAVRAQLGVHQRLEAAERMLLARMESGTLGLEGLVARLAEIIALAETTVSPSSADGDRLDALVDELEGLRAGLIETEDVSRRALAAYREAG